MAQFLTKLKTEQEHDREYFWRTTSPLVYKSDIVYGVIVPKGFEFDKNSIPFYLRWLFPVSGRRSDYAATLHDWLYTTELFPREVCDEIYYEAMLLSKVSNWRAKSKFMAVKTFGHLVWKQHTRESLEKARSLLELRSINKVLKKHGLPKETHLSWNVVGDPMYK